MALRATPEDEKATQDIWVLDPPERTTGGSVTILVTWT